MTQFENPADPGTRRRRTLVIAGATAALVAGAAILVGVVINSGGAGNVAAPSDVLSANRSGDAIDVDVDVSAEASASPTPTVSATASPTSTPSPTATPSKAATASSAPVAVSLGGWPTETGSVKVSATTPVPAGQPFDGGMKRYYGIGDGGQSESQDPMFKLADGAVLQNVIIGAPAGDGVHCSGSCTIRNVWWLDVGEDAATFRGGDSSIFLVDGGGARSADDKTFQHNGGGTLTIRNFQISGFGKLYRSCGNCGTQYKRTVIVQNVTATYPGKTLVGINSNLGDTATLTGITIIGDSSRKIVICERFKGVTSGEPDSIGSGPDGTYCKYTPSNVTYR